MGTQSKRGLSTDEIKALRQLSQSIKEGVEQATIDRRYSRRSIPSANLSHLRPQSWDAVTRKRGNNGKFTQTGLKQ